MKYEIRKIDAWRNEEGVWTWNDSRKIGEFKTNAMDQKRAFLYALHKMGIVLKRGKFTIDESNDIYEVQERRTQEPILAAIPIN